MRLPRRRQSKLIEPGRQVCTKVLELETAKEILAEVFQARPNEVEDMIQIRLEKRICLEGLGERLWPATFCLVD